MRRRSGSASRSTRSRRSAAATPAVVALGGGAIGADRPRGARERAVTVLVEIDPDEAWRACAGMSARSPRTRPPFRTLYEERLPLYDDAADARARDVGGAVLAAGGVHVELGALERLGELVPGEGPVEIVSDARVAGIYGMDVQLALGARLGRATSCRRESRRRPSVAGASLARPAAGTWRHACRARRWLHDRRRRLRRSDISARDRLGRRADDPRRPGGRCDRRQDRDRPPGRQEPRRLLSLAGAHRDRPATLETLPDAELANGRAEMVKTGLLAGEPFWELQLAEQVRRSAAFKTALCLRDPHDRGERAQLNLGHTFAHALEAAAGFDLPHGQAVALGLLAALRLSGLDTAIVERELQPEPVRVDRDAAWAALSRDKKFVDGVPRLVLLEAPGRPRLGVELPAADVRAALDSLIAG